MGGGVSRGGGSGAGAHHAPPVAVAYEGDDGVEGIEHGVEVDSFVDVEPDAYGVDGYPGYPLFDVFPGEHPHGHYAQGRGEGVGQRHRAVGEEAQSAIERGPEEQAGRGAAGQPSGRYAGDGQWDFLLLSRPCPLAAGAGPGQIAVDGYGEIVDVDCEVGIEPFVEVDPHRDGRHHYRGEPEARVGVVFPPEVEQSDAESERFEYLVPGECGESHVRMRALRWRVRWWWPVRRSLRNGRLRECRLPCSSPRPNSRCCSISR